MPLVLNGSSMSDYLNIVGGLSASESHGKEGLRCYVERLRGEKE